MHSLRAALILALTTPVLACGGVEHDDTPLESADDAAAGSIAPGSTAAATGAEAVGVLPPLVVSRIAYRYGSDVHSMASTGTGDVTHTSGSHPSYSDGRTRMAYATAGAIKVVEAPFDAAAFAAAITVYQGTGTWAGVDPSMSLDGTKVTFATAGSAGYGAHLFVYTLGTNNPVTLVVGDGTWVFSPTFNASGTQVAYTTGTPSIVNGLDIRRLSATAVAQPAATAGVLVVSGGYKPAFSPNGLKLAFYRQVAGQGYDIFIADASGANPVSWAGNSDYDDVDPTFSPGSGSIAFVSKRSYVSCAGQLCFFGNTDHNGKNLWKGTLSASSLDNLTTNSSAFTYVGTPSWQ